MVLLTSSISIPRMPDAEEFSVNDVRHFVGKLHGPLSPGVDTCISAKYQGLFGPLVLTV